MGEDLTAPAGWSAVGALVAAFGSPAFSAELHRAWRQAGSIFEPMPYWDDPGEWWSWVAVPTGPLATLRPATSAARLAAVFADAVPSRRRRVEREFRARTDQALSDRLWTAAVAYVVAFDTQTRDSPQRRSPWHLLESFDAVPDQWPADGGELARAAVDSVRKAFGAPMGLGWEDYLQSDDDATARRSRPLAIGHDLETSMSTKGRLGANRAKAAGPLRSNGTRSVHERYS